MSTKPARIEPEEQAKQEARGQGLFLDKEGQPVMFWNAINDGILNGIVQGLSGDDEFARNVLRGEVKKVALELAGLNPSAAVVMLAQTAALAWAELRRAQVILYERGERSIDIWTYRDKRAERANARYLRAVKTLTEVKRLESRIPTVQINVLNVEARPEGQAETKAELCLNRAGAVCWGADSIGLPESIGLPMSPRRTRGGS